jgi:hypothetical protein
MIDPRVESIYNVVLTIFLGIVMVLLFDQMFSQPRIVEIYLDSHDEDFTSVNTNCFSNSCGTPKKLPPNVTSHNI